MRVREQVGRRRRRRLGEKAIAGFKLANLAKMSTSIRNQFVTPHGQPVFPSSRGNNGSQDILQQIPMTPSLHRSLSMKKTTMVSTSSGSSAQGASFRSNTKYLIKNNQKENGNLNSITVVSDNNKDKNHIPRLITPTEQRNRQKAVSISTGFEPLTLSNVLRTSTEENQKFNLTSTDDTPVEPPELFCLNPSGTLSVVVSSAVKLGSEQMDQIGRKMQRVTGFREVMLENTIDSSLIAGFVITYGKEGSHVIDLSVKGQLAELAAGIDSTDHIIAAKESKDHTNK